MTSRQWTVRRPVSCSLGGLNSYVLSLKEIRVKDQITLSSAKIVLSDAYRQSKSTDLTYFLIELMAFIYHYGDIIVMGNFNIDFQCESTERHSLLYFCRQDIMLHIQISDLSFTSNGENVVSCGHLAVPSASHHNIIYVDFDLQHTKILCYDEKVNSRNCFKLSLMDKHVPPLNKRLKRPPASWLTKSITEFMRKRGSTIRLFKRA
ncbi:hypothetical protein PR048_020095, partial [Dryococelus australis]